VGPPLRGLRPACRVARSPGVPLPEVAGVRPVAGMKRAGASRVERRPWNPVRDRSAALSETRRPALGERSTLTRGQPTVKQEKAGWGLA
jgi:hypothetical protein